MNREKQYSLFLLAGGKSSRMGQDKALLKYKNKTFVDTLLEKARMLGIEEIYLSGHSEEEEQARIIWDIYPDRGPLGGIHACMKVMSTPYCLVLPVDVPQIPLEVLDELLRYHEVSNDGFVSNVWDGIAEKEKNHCRHRKKTPLILQHGDRKEYLIGIYPVEMLSFIENRIKDHPASVHGMLEAWGYESFSVDVPECQVANINTLEEYQKLTSCNFIDILE